MKIYVIYNTDTREIYLLSACKKKAANKLDLLKEELFPDAPMLGVYNTNTQSLDGNIWDNIELIEDDSL